MRDVHHRRAVECVLAAQHFVEYRAHREEIGPRIDRLPLQRFRRHVPRRPEQHAGLRQLRQVGSLDRLAALVH